MRRQLIRAAGISLSLNFVIHRRNIDHLPQIIELTETLNAERVELANVQYYGWGFLTELRCFRPANKSLARERSQSQQKSVSPGKSISFMCSPIIMKRDQNRV